MQKYTNHVTHRHFWSRWIVITWERNARIVTSRRIKARRIKQVQFFHTVAFVKQTVVICKIWTASSLDIPPVAIARSIGKFIKQDIRSNIAKWARVHFVTWFKMCSLRRRTWRTWKFPGTPTKKKSGIKMPLATLHPVVGPPSVEVL